MIFVCINEQSCRRKIFNFFTKNKALTRDNCYTTVVSVGEFLPTKRLRLGSDASVETI